MKRQQLKEASQALLLCAAMAMAPLVHAASEVEAPDAEEKIDDGLKGFGYLTGLALGCVATEQRTALEREAMDLNAEIGRLLGIDRAFLFAAGFGHGAGVELNAFAEMERIGHQGDAHAAKKQAMQQLYAESRFGPPPDNDTVYEAKGN